MKNEKLKDSNLYVSSYPVAGELVIGEGRGEKHYYLMSPNPNKTWNFGQVVALVFDVVPKYTLMQTNDGVIVHPHLRTVVVGVGTPWYIEYKGEPENIVVVDYEIVSE